MPQYRPNPDELLKSISKSDDAAARGKLKIFFGMSPGVGKTYAMLKAAQERHASGIALLVGWVDTHQRIETEALVKDLPLLPRKKQDYKGTQIEAFDIDRALELKPSLILVDELAHTNAPGSRHPKRYQDVEELLHAGIDVYTTLNVQHIASRVDLVYQITGVPVRESVPDGFLEKADEIEIVDISPEQLLKRLKDGKVYLGDRADRAAQNFFKEEALIALRELALRFTAEMVDDRLRDQMTLKGIAGPWNTNERLMVAISHSPFSARLIRATRRMAYNLEAPWVALYVETGQTLTTDDEVTLKKNLDLAREMGGEVIARKETSVSDALMNVAREQNVTQIVMGRPDRRLFSDLFGRGNLLDQLVRETSEIDIHIIRQRRRPKIVGFKFPIPKISSSIQTYIKTALFITAVALINYFLLPYLGHRTLGFVFLLAVLPVALFAGLGPTLLAALMSSMIWDFCFIPPQFTFAIREHQDMMMIVAYFSVAAVAGFMAQRLRKQEQDLIQRENRASILYEFERKLAETSSASDIAMHAARSIEKIFGFSSVVFPANHDQSLSSVALTSDAVSFDTKDFAVAQWSHEHRKKAGKGTDTLFSSRCLCYPLLGRSHKMGVLVVYPDRSLPIDQENLLETVAGNLASALERENLENTARRTLLLEQSEKMHQTLLNSVSHELRTPLTSIMGVASALDDDETLSNSTLRKQHLQNLSESSERLNTTIANLLDLTRLSTGVLQIQKEYFEMNDFVSGWLSRSKKHFRNHEIKLIASQSEIYVQGDEKLLDTVLTNLVANACNHSPAQSTIQIEVSEVQGLATLKVIDQGTGIKEEHLPHLFERFFRGTTGGNGLGIGLSIVQSIVEAHEGSLTAANRSDRTGAIFTVSIPSKQLSQSEGFHG